MLVEYEACQARIEAKVRAFRPQSPAVAAHPLTGLVPCRGADRARGSMARAVVKKRIDQPNDLKLLEIDGYSYDERLSSEMEWVFTR